METPRPLVKAISRLTVQSRADRSDFVVLDFVDVWTVAFRKVPWGAVRGC